jgi:hypothetical protein
MTAFRPARFPHRRVSLPSTRSWRASRAAAHATAVVAATLAATLANLGAAGAAPAAPPVPPRAQVAFPGPAGAPTAPPAGTGPPSPSGPIDAATSLERVRAAYEYGDIDGVVEWARPVAEGRIAATVAERGHALRYLGIGLYLTGRTPGAEAAFLELLRLRPDSTLDPRTTRPDVVTFFERVRSSHAVEIRATARENNHKIFALNFLPPFGQIQNGHRGRAVIYGALELASAATAITTYAVLSRWEQPNHLFGDHYNDATKLKVVNYTAIGVFAATCVISILDGLASYTDLPDEAPSPRGPASGVALGLGPTGLSVTF